MRKSNRKSTLDALLPKVRQQVLTATLLDSARWWYLSDLAKHLTLTPSSLQRELASLVKAQILVSKKESNRVYYKANQDSPLFEDLLSLVVKTSGLIEQIKTTLKPHFSKINISFIYGSFARQAEVAESDIDLMIVGDVKLSEIAPTARKLERQLKRDLNITIYTQLEFLNKFGSGDSFLQTVAGAKKIFVKGTEDELKKMG